MQALLVMFRADGSRRDFPIKPNRRYVIGRQDKCDLRIPLSDVSREHAAVFFDEEEDELVIEDLGSSNGTWVNEEKVERADLCPGDIIAIGPVPFQVAIDGHPAEIDTIRMASASRHGQTRAITGKEEADDIPLGDDDEVVMSNSGGATDDDDSFFDFDLDDDD